MSLLSRIVHNALFLLLVVALAIEISEGFDLKETGSRAIPLKYLVWSIPVTALLLFLVVYSLSRDQTKLLNYTALFTFSSFTLIVSAVYFKSSFGEGGVVLSIGLLLILLTLLKMRFEKPPE